MFHLFSGKVQSEYDRDDWQSFRAVWAESAGKAADEQADLLVGRRPLMVEVWHVDECHCWSGAGPDCPHGADWYACPTCEPYMTPDVCSEHRAGCPVGAH